MRGAVLLLVLGSVVASRHGMLGPGHRFKASSISSGLGNTCDSLSHCESCTAIKFCMWHKSGYCRSEAHVKASEAYDFFQGSCHNRAGDWLELGAGVETVRAKGEGPSAAEAQALVAASSHGAQDTYQYQPLMMQPPAIASQDEDHIFQGPFPRPDYGMGELGYKLQGLEVNYEGDETNTPRHACPGNPLNGCLEKPVIIPQGGVHFDVPESRGEFKGHPRATKDRSNHNGFKQQPHPHSLMSLSGFTKPKWEDQYDDKDDIDK